MLLHTTSSLVLKNPLDKKREFLSDNKVSFTSKLPSSEEEEEDQIIRIREVRMGAKKSSFSSFCGIFKSCFSNGSRDDYYYEDGSSGGRIFASDEDRGRWVAEPGIDRKASAFIARFYASRVSDSEHQFAS